jgi:hypothetical protein
LNGRRIHEPFFTRKEIYMHFHNVSGWPWLMKVSKCVVGERLVGVARQFVRWQEREDSRKRTKVIKPPSQDKTSLLLSGGLENTEHKGGNTEEGKKEPNSVLVTATPKNSLILDQSNR